MSILDCGCDIHGSEETICDEYGICLCKENVIGDKCTECDPESGFFGFPECNKSKSSSIISYALTSIKDLILPAIKHFYLFRIYPNFCDYWTR